MQCVGCVCALRSWCPDRTTAQARKYIADSMGPKYADPVILDLRAMWEESDPRTPMICLLSMGSDPTAMIEDLAKKNGIGGQFCVKNFMKVCGKSYSHSSSRTVGAGADLQFSRHRQPAGDVSHKPSSRLPLLSSRLTFTFPVT